MFSFRKCEDNSLVVWKEVSLDGVGDRGVSESQNEVQLLSLLQHPSIIAYYTHFVDPRSNSLYIEMEYAEHGTLYHRIVSRRDRSSIISNGDARGDPFPELDVLWYMYQLLHAMAYIHARRVLHRDIKTLNIFVARSDAIKLGDFGISKLLGLNSHAEMANSIVGTPYYMSPEINRGFENFYHLN